MENLDLELLLAQIKRNRDGLARGVTRIGIPEAGLRLDLESRKGERVREIKHIQQYCLMHAESFRLSAQIRSLYLVDGFLSMAELRNPLGLYFFGRAMLELAAFTAEVVRRLRNACDRQDSMYIQKGQEFFNVITRARYASSDPPTKTALAGMGLNEERMKPFNIMAAIRAFESQPDAAELVGLYDKYSDALHHNMSSQFSVVAGHFQSQGYADPVRGFGFLTNEETSFLVYEYPTMAAGQRAVEELAPQFLKIMAASVSAINGLPPGPFSEEFLIRETGTRYGLEWRPFPEARPSVMSGSPAVPKVGRNEPCPCGSGKKFKYCCLAQGSH